MSKTEHHEMMQDFLTDLKKARDWLQRSYNICKDIGLKERYEMAEYDHFEVLSSRFARVCDYIINKAYRTLDRFELVSGGTILDTINRAHKRGLIDNPEKARILKELRNEISHEYSNRELQNLFEEIFEYTPTLLTWVEKLDHYFQQHYVLKK